MCFVLWAPEVGEIFASLLPVDAAGLPFLRVLWAGGTKASWLEVLRGMLGN